jgi:hypothetical protein
MILLGSISPRTKGTTYTRRYKISHNIMEIVRCIFVHVYFPHLLGGFLHILTCTCNYMLWPLALREYNLSIPNMVSEPRVKGSCDFRRQLAPASAGSRSGRLHLCPVRRTPSVELLAPSAPTSAASGGPSLDSAQHRSPRPLGSRSIPSLGSPRPLSLVLDTVPSAVV